MDQKIVGTDPISGNEVPVGARPEEVRDDVDAKLSEGEFVVPANVVRFFGVKFFEDLIAGAQEGYSKMQAAGRMPDLEPMDEGLEEEDDFPFSLEELEVEDDEEVEPEIQMAEGGLVSSPRPRTRADAQKDELSRGDVEFRADLEDQLSWNPLARLAYDPGTVRSLPYDLGFQAHHIKRGTPEDIQKLYEDVDPKREHSPRIKQGDVAVYKDMAKSPIISHEMTHKGFNMVMNSFLDDPKAFREKYGEENGDIMRAVVQNLSSQMEELTVEDFDDLKTEMLFGDQKKRTMRETGDYGHRNTEEFQEKVAKTPQEDRWPRYEKRNPVATAFFDVAQQMLQEKGEPPKTKPDYPNLFERMTGLKFAEGGMVPPAMPAGPSVESKRYTGPDGQMTTILFIDGRPVTPIPRGYTAAATEEKAKPEAQKLQVKIPQKEPGKGPEKEQAVKERPPVNEWSNDYLSKFSQNFGQQVGVSKGVSTALNMVGAGLGGKLVGKAMDFGLNKAIEDVLNEIDARVEAGTMSEEDAQKNRVALGEQKERLAKSTGGGLLSKVVDAGTDMLGLGGDRETTTTAANTTSNESLVERGGNRFDHRGPQEEERPNAGGGMYKGGLVQKKRTRKKKT